MCTIWGGLMNKIVRFDSESTFRAYINSKKYKVLGTGSEGTCYLGKDGLAYKDLTDGLSSEIYIPEKIITTTERQNSSFAFPHVLFVVDGVLVGYTSDVVPRDITSNRFLFDHGIDHIDFKNLYDAYEVVYDNAIKLANEGIAIYDLSFNLLFDGENLTGVDTCGYYRAPVSECRHNTECVDQAVKDLFVLYVRYAHDEELDTSMDVKTFLTMVENKYSNHGNKKGKSYIKQ